jgi:hypothetical protein
MGIILPLGVWYNWGLRSEKTKYWPQKRKSEMLLPEMKHRNTDNWIPYNLWRSSCSIGKLNRNIFAFGLVTGIIELFLCTARDYTTQFFLTHITSVHSHVINAVACYRLPTVLKLSQCLSYRNSNSITTLRNLQITAAHAKLWLETQDGPTKLGYFRFLTNSNDASSRL